MIVYMDKKRASHGCIMLQDARQNNVAIKREVKDSSKNREAL